ncbi:MAG: aminopeptidase [Candidatus Aenigmarchaeota archaeon]|nr:aminopeptidase [Candidatus Aenigmarchaeota archaeon]
MDNDLHIPSLDTILKNGWDIRDGDTALIITDTGIGEDTLAPLLAKKEKEALETLGCNCTLLTQQIKTDTDYLDQSIFEQLSTLPKGAIVMVAVSNNIGLIPAGTIKNFKTFVLERDLRLIYSLGLSKIRKENWNIFADAISFDPTARLEELKRMKYILDNGNHITITTTKGTGLNLDIRGRKAHIACGLHQYRSTNIPFGEIYIAPNETKTTGIVMIDGTIKTLAGSHLLKDDFYLEFKDGRLIKNTSKELRDTIKTIKQTDRNIDVLAEFGIGLNPKATLIGNTLVDEKTLGTAHIALGMNTVFGGTNSCSYHLDQVFKNPEILVDGKILKM